MTKKTKQIKKDISWPSDAELRRVKKSLSSPNALISRNVPDDAPLADRAKFQLCQAILKYKFDLELSSVELSKVLDCPTSRVSEILHCRIEKFTVDRLLSYYERLGYNESFSKRLPLVLQGLRV